jgi:hypothetical protein
VSKIDDTETPTQQVARLPGNALAELLDQVRGFAAADPAPDPMELTRMWLLTVTDGVAPASIPEDPGAAGDTEAPPPGASRGSIYVTEVHGSARMLLTADGRAYLTPPDRELIGFGFAIPETALPSPNELEDWLAAQLAAHESGQAPLGLTAKWRLQRLERQLPKAARTPATWSEFVLRNDVSYMPATVYGVWLADGRRCAVTVTAATGAAADVGNADGFWDRNAFTAFGRALCSA